MPENFDALLQSAGFDTPDVEVTNTGEAFEYYKHCEGKYSGLVGIFNVDYVNFDNKKCEPSTPGAKRKDFGMLDLLITSSPDNHGFKTKEFGISNGQVYGEFIFKLFVSFVGDRQYQNKNLFDTFKIAGAPTTDVIKPGSSDNDFKLDSKAFGFYRGAPVTFEIKVSPKGTRYVTNLQLQDNLLTQELFKQRIALVDGIYGKLEELKKKEKEERDARKKQSSEDKALSGTSGGFTSQPSEDDMMADMMGHESEFK